MTGLIIVCSLMTYSFIGALFGGYIVQDKNFTGDGPEAVYFGFFWPIFSVLYFGYKLGKYLGSKK